MPREDFLGEKEMDEKKEKKSTREIPIQWFILTIIIAVVLSFVISLVVLNISSASAQKYSVDSGSIVVQIQPDFGQDSGKIIVDVKDNSGGNS